VFALEGAFSACIDTAAHSFVAHDCFSVWCSSWSTKTKFDATAFSTEQHTAGRGGLVVRISNIPTGGATFLSEIAQVASGKKSQLHGRRKVRSPDLGPDNPIYANRAGLAFSDSIKWIFIRA
jgi:hypothetical protein